MLFYIAYCNIQFHLLYWQFYISSPYYRSWWQLDSNAFPSVRQCDIIWPYIASINLKPITKCWRRRILLAHARAPKLDFVLLPNPNLAFGLAKCGHPDAIDGRWHTHKHAARPLRLRWNLPEICQHHFHTLAPFGCWPVHRGSEAGGRGLMLATIRIPNLIERCLPSGAASQSANRNCRRAQGRTAQSARSAVCRGGRTASRHGRHGRTCANARIISTPKLYVNFIIGSDK